MKYKSIGTMDREKSEFYKKMVSCEKLPGAISDANFFSFFDIDLYHRVVPDWVEIDTVTKGCNVLYDGLNGMFINQNGAIAAAFDLRKLDFSSQQKEIEKLLLDYRSTYPEYDFSILPGIFPIDVLGTSTEGKFEVETSSHILYIKDYEKHIVKNSNNKTYKK